jgi:hypothetical protein
VAILDARNNKSMVLWFAIQVWIADRLSFIPNENFWLFASVQAARRFEDPDLVCQQNSSSNG